MYQTVIFDLFGTLVEDAKPDVIDQMARELGVPVEQFSAAWGQEYAQRARGEKRYEDSVSSVCQSLGLKRSAEQMQSVADVRLKELRRNLRSVRPDALEVLTAVRKAGLSRGLLSNASIEVVESWPMCDLVGHFEATVFSCDAGRMKPDPEIFALICGQLHVSPEACLFIGDGGDDEFRGAKGVDMTTVQLRTGRPVAADVHFLVNRLSDLLPILASPSGATQAAKNAKE